MKMNKSKMKTFTKPQITGKYAAAYLENQKINGLMDHWNSWIKWGSTTSFTLKRIKWFKRWANNSHIPFTQEGHDDEWATFLKVYFPEVFELQFEGLMVEMTSIPVDLLKGWVEKYQPEKDIQFTRPKGDDYVAIYGETIPYNFLTMKCDGIQKVALGDSCTGDIGRVSYVVKGKVEDAFMCPEGVQQDVKNFEERYAENGIYTLKKDELYYTVKGWKLKRKGNCVVLVSDNKKDIEYFKEQEFGEDVKKALYVEPGTNIMAFVDGVWEGTSIGGGIHIICESVKEFECFEKEDDVIILDDASHVQCGKGEWIVLCPRNQEDIDEFRKLKIDGIKKASWAPRLLYKDGQIIYYKDGVIICVFCGNKMVEEMKEWFDGGSIYIWENDIVMISPNQINDVCAEGEWIVLYPKNKEDIDEFRKLKIDGFKKAMYPLDGYFKGSIGNYKNGVLENNMFAGEDKFEKLKEWLGKDDVVTLTPDDFNGVALKKKGKWAVLSSANNPYFEKFDFGEDIRKAVAESLKFKGFDKVTNMIGGKLKNANVTLTYYIDGKVQRIIYLQNIRKVCTKLKEFIQNDVIMLKNAG